MPKAEKLQAIHAVVIGNDVFVKEATGVGKSVCYVEVPYVCDFLRSESDVSSKSVLLIVSPLRTFALIVCAQRYCAGNATVICHALLRALVKLRF